MSAPDIAALLLLDPTFSLMSSAERRGEALELMRFNGLEPDELEAAVYAEEAEERHANGETPPADAPPVLLAGLEPCREERASCASPVAANGRCMECGARRALEEPTSAAILPAIEQALAFAETMTPQEREAVVMGDTLQTPPPGFLARFKASTGNNDRQIGDMLNMARSSVQAIVGGRVGENLTPEQLRRMDQAIAGQLAALGALRAEIRG